MKYTILWHTEYVATAMRWAQCGWCAPPIGQNTHRLINAEIHDSAFKGRRFWGRRGAPPQRYAAFLVVFEEATDWVRLVGVLYKRSRRPRMKAGQTRYRETVVLPRHGRALPLSTVIAAAAAVDRAIEGP
jgi:hypothetical protein